MPTTPRPRPVRSTGRPAAALVSFAVVTGLLTVSPLAAHAAGGPSPAPSATAAKPPTRPAPDKVQEAIARAKREGRDVPVPELTDEYTTVVATAGGKLRSEQHQQAQRAKRTDGSWAALDDTLVKRPDGTVAPTVASGDLVISGGGTGPLATMTTQDGRQLAVSSPFPGPLPAPVLTGNGALFRDVAPDTDLQVNASKWGGYTTVVVLRTPAAAANPAVRTLVFPTATKGLELGKTAEGALTASAGGEAVFTAPTPQMWSAKEARTPAARAAAKSAAEAFAGSAPRALGAPKAAEAPAGQPTEASAATRTAPDAPSTTAGPGSLATVADIPVTGAEVHDKGGKAEGAITLTPSPDLLDGPSTSYPVYVDPSWGRDARGKQHHAWVMQAHSTTGNFDRTGSNDRDRPGSGYQGWESPYGIERALYEFDLNGYAGATINYANLQIKQYISSDHSCTTTYPVNLYRAREFDSSVSWGNHQVREWIEGKNVPGNGTLSECYNDIPIDFNITNALRDGIRNTGVPLAFAVLGQEGSGQRMGFKRYSYDATLSSEYDFPPRVPTNERVTPAPHRVTASDTDACADVPVSSYGYVTNTTATLRSTVSSPNQGQLTEYVSIWDNTTGGNTVNNGWSGFVGTGNEAAYDLPVGLLQNGHHYGWYAQGDDGLLRGPAGTVCHFAVDLTPPVFGFGAFTDPATQFPPAGNGRTTQLKLGDTGHIPVTASDPSPGAGLISSGLACVEWSYDPQLAGAERTCAPGGSLAVTDITTKPTHWGTNVLYARAVDEAGNSSQTYSYAFYVPWAPGPVAFGDTTGDARPDILLADTAGNLVTHGRATDAGNASVPPTGTAAPAAQAPGYDSPTNPRTWKDYRVSHRGSLDPTTNLDDLFVHKDPSKPGAGDGDDALYYYSDTLSDPGRFTRGTATTVDRPDCDTAYATSCNGHHDGGSWALARQITPIGSAKDTRTPSRRVTDATGVFAIDSDSLWFYPVKTNHTLAPPSLVSAGGWDDKDLMVPGNTLAIGATTATTPALWVRNRTNGDIFQYAPTTAGRPDGSTTVTALTANPATRIGYGITAGSYPTVGSDGDVTDDQVPDFWAADASGNLHVWAATTASGKVNGFTGEHIRGTTQAPYAQWRLTGDATANPAGYNGTANGVAWTDDTVDGHATKVAAFDGTRKSDLTAKYTVDTRKSFTVSTWAYLAKDDAGMIVSQETAHGSSFMIYGDHGTWKFAIAQNDASNAWPYDWTSAMGPAAAYQLNTWTQLTASYNADTGQMNLYVNGSLAGTAQHAASTSPTATGSLVVGRYRNNDASSNYLTGRVSNLAVYNTAVTATTSNSPVRFATHVGRCMDAPDNNTGNGMHPQLWDCNGTDAQRFSLNANGTLTINGQCVAASGNGTASGTAIILWTCLGEGGQQWRARADGSLYNPQSGLCLDVPWANSNPGTVFQLFTCNGTPAQRWSIPTVNTPVLPVNP
ncbi:ricin-type beta-trefoil lectin domain protein [Kitasatospora sp. A2-31]|uniref:ricin-type beta-trefoil lectin domain protein n=1 Tax=Kitasatospora sp. A2-31 TaxID=2916414 RepID=UPI001EEBAE71|nr:ricin-type beta-trefoil lectin domain protein [Kitasatospora sp. A2-31]MCG6496063.1 ricin-type beta-trefoil lectin domain protein [Kitasatospora sp. A2-31]